ncbi:MAG: thiamine ABC transporter substrate-binding protein [Chloroflexi bacterium]|nr:thiamine ABC transporter substrate-binding protein [Chloroflexota bacterium]
MKKLTLLLSAFCLLLAACTPASTETPTPSGPVTLTVMTHDSFAVSKEVVAEFEQANNAKLVFMPSGDAGSALNKAILSKDAPLADVFYGVDNTFLSRALEADIFEAYASPALADIPAEFQLDAQKRALPVDYGDVCINYDKAYFAEKNLSVPQSLEDLTQPEYKGLLAVENPATSSPGLAFLLATIKHFGETGYLDYWTQLRDNGLVVTDGWETAYYTNFSGSSGKGPQPMVVSYATSPAAEFLFADPPVDEAPTASILGPDTCFRQIEFVGILKGTAHPDLAQKFVDFMLSADFQNDMPMQMFVLPVSTKATVPDAFTQYADTASASTSLDPASIAANRESWINAWTETVVR